MNHIVTFTAPEKAELISSERSSDPLAADEIEGRTLATLISAGTEIESSYRNGKKFPVQPGYAAVIEVVNAGAGVTQVTAGQRVFCMGGHRSWIRAKAVNVVAVPNGLASETALLARLMGVSMSTLTTTQARPGDLVLVTGLGLVGNLCAQMFQNCGFEVIACDPSEGRRTAAREAGIARVEPAIPLEDGVTGKAALHVECSGHEQAVLDGCKAVRKRGEVVMVGVPWRKRTEIHSFDILHAVFHNYIVLRSGWEWELPLHPEAFRPRSIFENYTSALKWLANGRVKSDGLISRRSPRDCQAAYQDLMHQRAATPGLVFDWTAL